MKRRMHLSDDRLVDMCLDAMPTVTESEHLHTCERCSGRHSRLFHVLREVYEAGVAEADAAFPQARLDRQRAHILTRILHEGRPARVIAFPTATASEIRPLRARPATRWIAGAAAAGVVVGLVAGHLAHDLSPAGSSNHLRARVAAARAETASARRLSSSISSDDEFIGQMERLADGPTLPVLQPLNDLTPQ
jgi:hypothetical protein